MTGSLIYLLLSSSLMMLLVLLLGLSIKSTRHNRYWPLVLFLFCVAVQLLQALLSMGEFYSKYPQLMHVGTWLLFVNGPACWWTLAAKKNMQLNKWHLVPSVIAFIWLMTFYQLDETLKPFVYYGNGNNKMFFWLLFLVHWSVYLLAVVIKSKKLKGSTDAFFRLVIASSFCYILASLLTWVGVFFYDSYWKYLDLFSLSSLIMMVVGIVMLLITKTGHLVQIERAKPELGENFKACLHQKIVKERKFCEAELTIKDVAQILGRSPRELSRWFNYELKTNFKGWLNKQRIKEAKNLIKNQHDLMVSTIGYEVGFNSPATFYRAFKQETGTSPGGYRKKHQETDKKS